MSRGNWALGVLLLVQVGLLWWTGAAPPAPGALLADLRPGAIRSVRLLGAPAEADGPPQDVLTLRRAAAGGWELVELGGYPARAGAVEALLHTLATRKRGPAVLRDPRHQGALGLGPGRYQAAVELTDGARRWRLRLGQPAGPGGVYAAVDDAVIAVPGLRTEQLSARPWAWAEPRYLDVPSEALRGLTLRGPDGALRLCREDLAQPWRVAAPPVPQEPGSDPQEPSAEPQEPGSDPQEPGQAPLASAASPPAQGQGRDGGPVAVCGPAVDDPGGCQPEPARVAPLIDAARTLTLAAPVGRAPRAAYGLTPGRLQVALRTPTGVHRYTVGARTPSGDARYVRAEGSGFIVTVPAPQLQPLLSATRAALCPPGGLATRRLSHPQAEPPGG